MIRRTTLGVVLAIVAVACTGDDPVPESSRPSTSSCTLGEAGCDVEVETRGVRYAAECRPVAESLVDVDLPRHPGQPKLKAITGVARSQGVAVLWNDPTGCGLWVLALTDDLTAATATSIRDEVSRGVERFGVTASPIPDDEGEG